MTNDSRPRSHAASRPALPRTSSTDTAHKVRSVARTPPALASGSAAAKAVNERFRVSATCHGELVVTGEVDAATVRRLDDQLDSWLATDGWQLRSCDMRGVTFFSAAGANWLLRRLVPIRPPVRVVISPEVHRVLELCGLDLPEVTRADSDAA